MCLHVSGPQVQIHLLPAEIGLEFHAMYLAAVIIEIRPMVFPCPDQLQHIGRVSPEICELRTVIRMQQFPFPDGTYIKLLSFFRNREYRILAVATRRWQDTSPIPCDFIHIQQAVVCPTSHAKRQLVIDLFFKASCQVTLSSTWLSFGCSQWKRFS